jgi:hypothetical protein
MKMNITIEVDVEYNIEPAQHGGRTDPSWEAYAILETVTVGEGRNCVDILGCLNEETRNEIADAAEEDCQP